MQHAALPVKTRTIEARAAIRPADLLKTASDIYTLGRLHLLGMRPIYMSVDDESCLLADKARREPSSSDDALTFHGSGPIAKGKRMKIRRDKEHQGFDLDRYGDGDEATIRRESSSESELEPYEEDDVATVPLTRRMV